MIDRPDGTGCRPGDCSQRPLPPEVTHPTPEQRADAAKLRAAQRAIADLRLWARGDMLPQVNAIQQQLLSLADALDRDRGDA